ncbi:acyltransferase [Kaistia sp. 32K]|uniref:acyltransferase family protein n=1 Tax=Kaistia sp. 32K TaxID=2795690 RepID=UPI001915CA39|nr:acyltransferase family protein [Kaistia sp. 32K]BCP53858.1 acyltransferase [Kaistia sp. 32K]
MPSPAFRTDINGLRAWAVVSVILFHFGISGFSGGFVGVDVFFVLSGFLMAGIVLAGVEKVASGKQTAGNFLANFYLARARRILPALLVLCAVLMILGWSALSPQEYRLLGRHTVTALAFVSNIRFSREFGYFDIDAHQKILLHTWSLAVEWQFYLLFPIVVLVLWRLMPSRRKLTLALAGFALGSLLLSVFTSATYPERAFFLLPWRAWELLAGALVFLLARTQLNGRSTQIGLEIVGIALILGSVLLLDSSVAWPGWRAAIPVVGTALVLVAGRQDSWLTGTAVAQWLGRCSYSLYLWHWPVVFGLFYFDLQKDPVAIACGFFATAALGWLSYRFVETPARVGLSRLPLRAGYAAILVALLAVIVPSEVVKMRDGFPARLSPEVVAIFAEARNKNPRFEECHVLGQKAVPECIYGGPKLGVIVLGDSHAGAIIRSVEKVLPDPELHVLDWTRAGCRTISGMKPNTPDDVRCVEFVDYALRKIETLPEAPLVILNRTGIDTDPHEGDMTKTARKRDQAFYDDVREKLVATTCAFARTRPVYLVRPIPEMPVNVPVTLGRAALLGIPREVSISLEEYHQRHAFVWAAQDLAAQRCGVKILDPLPYLCTDGRCRGAFDGLPIYYDDDHLSERGGNRLIPMLRQIFEEPPVASEQQQSS